MLDKAIEIFFIDTQRWVYDPSLTDDDQLKGEIKLEIGIILLLIENGAESKHFDMKNVIQYLLKESNQRNLLAQIELLQKYR